MSDEVKPTPEDAIEDSKPIEIEEVIEAEAVTTGPTTDEPTTDAASEEDSSDDAAPDENASEDVVAEAASTEENSDEKATEKAVEKEEPTKDDAPAAAAEKPAEESAAATPLSTTMVPPEYVPAVRRGRNRRINIDINLNDVHYKNIPLLTRFLDPFGRILSRRKTKVSAKVQRRAVTAIKQARHLSLLPYTGDHTRLTRRKRR